MLKRIVIVFIFLVAMVGVGILISKIPGALTDDPPDLTELTVEQIADSHALFNSVLQDRSDITEGEFKRFPWVGDTFLMKLESLPEIHEETTSGYTSQHKNVSEDGRKIIVETRVVEDITKYWMGSKNQEDYIALGPMTTRDVMIKWNDEEIPVPVKIGVVARGRHISEETAQAIRDLSGDTHQWLVKTYNVRGKDGFLYLSDYLDYLEEGSCEPECSLRLGDLSKLRDILKLLQEDFEQRDLENERFIKIYPEFQKNLLENSEYQELDARLWKDLSEEEVDRWGLLHNNAWEQAREQIGELQRFDPKTAFQNITFVVVVEVEAIDGIKIESPD